ncbi:hypothetical protein A3J19_02080 [Candidatus Daviesbacteria bacterium RIFCSPLOWO2_02_FULL_41_8]|uniref:Uncharacterized protein n=3 Tax=Candidatus Daviesiibacteriota TaxID=1752718 RepID=A0A1F5NLR6_9BACT|nr:MAG: hypothetical protein A2871_02400 [Candidatus Daviesbacteria bacterium RIFCSPHIGHO2_01_FULL_41_23]OGE33766.1 MAG: hypothetical protein A3D83_04270 [Candidatus Daviesbacteria bacterium RIFCSPHIGHO2_02_FULL_41_10]OGE62033.1 MAG: hypothetical protein A2967_00015 [Candidatus Daviesbacteria bacterium RIFCSPLOWO2_01_FULL_41_32]OGE78462.1 MAG: hypothetical protein A3J19_02080 [Candidatus Daviesbacteria bacterium RIFCSPLOWO2_02_FULL_41_8]
MRTKPLEYDPVVHGYSVAVSYKYDITSIKDVVKILKKIRHENTSEEYAEKFSALLRLFDTYIRRKLNLEGKITREKLIKKGLIN